MDSASSGIYVFCLLFVSSLYLYANIIPPAFQGLFARINLALSLAALIIFARRLRQAMSTELKLLAAYGAWYIFVRLVHGELFPASSAILLTTFYVAVMGCCCFAAGRLLSSAGRKMLLNGLSILVGVFLFAISILAMYTAFTGKSTVYLPTPPAPATSTVFFSADTSATEYFIKICGLHKNLAAPWFLIGLCLMIYQFFACKRKLLKALAALCGVVFYITIALQRCRSIMVGTSVCLAMLAMLLVYRRVQGKSLKRIIPALALTAVFGTAVFFVGLDLCHSAFPAMVVENVQPEIAAQPAPLSASTLGEADPGDSELKPTAIDKNELRRILTLTYRTNIWASIVPTMAEQPSIALIGVSLDDPMGIPNKYTGLDERISHMHNMFLQALLLTGLPGMLLCLAFCVLLLMKMVKFFFSTSASVTMAEKSLLLPLAGLLVYGIVEPMIFTVNAFYTTCFYIISGIFLAIYSD